MKYLKQKKNKNYCGWKISYSIDIKAERIKINAIVIWQELHPPPPPRINIYAFESAM